jgi:hypothetical protein
MKLGEERGVEERGGRTREREGAYFAEQIVSLALSTSSLVRW